MDPSSDLNTRNQISHILWQRTKFLDQIKHYCKELGEVRREHKTLKQGYQDLEKQISETNRQMDKLVERYQNDVLSYERRIEKYQLEKLIYEKQISELSSEIEQKDFLIKSQESQIKHLVESKENQLLNPINVSQYQFDSDHTWNRLEYSIWRPFELSLNQNSEFK